VRSQNEGREKQSTNDATNKTTELWQLDRPQPPRAPILVVAGDPVATVPMAVVILSSVSMQVVVFRLFIGKGL
jgi:hypothetical protein